MVKITTSNISTWEDLGMLISNPLGFIIFLSILVAIVVFLIVVIKKRNAIRVRLKESQFKANEKYAMYSRKEWVQNIFFSSILILLIGGFIVFGILYIEKKNAYFYQY